MPGEPRGSSPAKVWTTKDMNTTGQNCDLLTKLAGQTRTNVELEREAVRAFAALNDWTWTDDVFSYRALSPGGVKPWHLPGWMLGGPLDHCLWFRDRSRRPVALVTQPYDYPDLEEEIQNFLSVVAVHTPPATYASIHYPGVARFIVFTKRGTSVEWLPEQADEFSRFAFYKTDWDRI